jgi:hypothetical protein
MVRSGGWHARPSIKRKAMAVQDSRAIADQQLAAKMVYQDLWQQSENAVFNVAA